MSTGMYLRAGDETSCGGVILEGYLDWLVDGRPVARDGDAVTCGRNPGKSYTIMGGVWFTMLDGRPAAGTLDSISSCPCEATLIPSVFHFSYQHNAAPARSPINGLPELAAILKPQEQRRRHEPFPFGQVGPLPISDLEQLEPGFHVVTKSTAYGALEAELFASPTSEVLRRFRALNPYRGQVKAGELMVLSDPNNKRCTYEESLLSDLSANVRAQLADVPAETADFVADNHQSIQDFLAYGSMTVGVGEAMIAQHMKVIEGILKEIEQLHVKAYQTKDGFKSLEFRAHRQHLFTRFNSQLTQLTRRAIGLPDHPKLKTALGISTRSLAHHWSKAGAPGQIPGYATHYAGVLKAGEYIKKAGYVGIGLGGTASYLKVKEICREGETEACKRVRVTESAAFLGSVGGGIYGGTVGAGLMGGLCILLGAPTAGLVTAGCAIVGAGTGAYSLTKVGGGGAERFADFIYENLQ